MISVTTQSPHFDDVICNMMLNLLGKCYPVIKIKDKNRFKRGVNVDGAKYSIPKDNLALFGVIYSNLKLYYDATDDEIIYVVKKYYNLNG
jgi:hypothetical protein